MGIFNKLLNVQSDLKAPKGQYNSFGKYRYRSCENILEAVKPLLKKEGLILQLHDQLIKEGERFYVQATATLIDSETAEKTSVSAFAREEETKKGMDGSQITGAASSYARKYALNGLFCIDDNSDSDITNQAGDVSSEDILELFETATQAGYSKATIFKQIERNYHKETPDLLTRAEFNQLLIGYKKLAKLKDGEMHEEK